MAVIETPVLLISKNDSGEKRLCYPITRADCVDGLEEVSLPSVTTEDNGKILKVVDGAWATDETTDSANIPTVDLADYGIALTTANPFAYLETDTTELLSMLNNPDVKLNVSMDGTAVDGLVCHPYSANLDGIEYHICNVFLGAVGLDFLMLAVCDGFLSVRYTDFATGLVPAVTENDNGKTLSVVDGAWAVVSDDGGVSSWNDLTDKPFYEDTPTNVEILAAQTITYDYTADMNLYMAFLPLEEEEYVTQFHSDECTEVTVIWGDSTYHCTKKLLDGIPAVGNSDLLLGTGDTKEPFVMGLIDGGLFVYDLETAPPEDTSTAATVQRALGVTLTLENVHTLDPKFIREVAWKKITDAPFGTIPDGTVLFDGTPGIYGTETNGDETLYYYIAAPTISAIPPAGTSICMEVNGVRGIGTVAIDENDGYANVSLTVGDQDVSIRFTDGTIVFVTKLSEALPVKLMLESDMVITLPEQYLPTGTIKAYIDEYIGEALGGDY